MKGRTAAGLAWSLWALDVLLWGVYLSLWAGGGFRPFPGGEPEASAGGVLVRVAHALAFAAIALTATVIAWRRPGHPAGWLLLAGSLAVGWQVFANEYVRYAAARGAAPLLGAGAGVAWAAAWLDPAGTALAAAALLLTPTGRLPSRRWRPALWLVVAGGAAATVAVALRPGPLPNAPALANPLAGAAGAGLAAAAVPRPAVVLWPVVGVVLGAGSLLLRFRRARGEEGQQLKWVASGAAPWALVLALSVVAPPAWETGVRALYVLALGGFVVALGVAILKHRLYQIDALLTRAVVYGVLAAFVTGVYVAVAAGAGAAVGTRGGPSLALSVAATALVAVAFQPVRERAQRLADRLVYGERANPYEVLAGFSRRIAGALSVEEVVPRMAEAAARGVGATRSRVRVFLPGGQEHRVAWPPGPAEPGGATRDGPGRPPAEPFARVATVTHQGEPVGEIAVAKPPGEALTPAEERLLADLAAQAGPALRNARLTVELRARLAELAEQAAALQASRQRLVAAQDAARRRLERDLHDGAQQHLVALAVTLGLARQLATHDPARVAALLDESAAQAREAMATLRDLARGLFPPLLADRGLAAALEAHRARTCPGATLEAGPGVAGARYAPEVEAGVYFCCLEALQNAARHAPGAPVSVRLAGEDGWLLFAVRDEGPGFDPGAAPPGAGLLNMADRMGALGGTLTVQTAPGAGTTVSGRAPLRRAGWAPPLSAGLNAAGAPGGSAFA